MDALVEYLIPVSGLKNGTHIFDFQINSDFFEHFPDSLIDNGIFTVQLVFEKRVDLYELVFSFEGTTQTPCDRCLTMIDFPIKGENKLLVKFAEEVREDVDVLYIPIKTEKLNVAKYIYEYISLAVPFIKIYDCESEENRPCDEKMLAVLEEKSTVKKENSGSNPLWDELKNIKFN